MDEKSLSSAADEAFKLWSECHVYLLKKIENQTRAVMALRAERKLQEKIPQPKKYPVTFDGFLRLMIGSGSKNRRNEIYVEYAKEMIWRGHVSQIQYPQSQTQKYASAVMTKEEAEKLAEPASPEEIVSVLDHVNQRIYGANQRQLYQMDTSDFLIWFAKYKANIRGKRARAGAAGLKKKRQKNGQTQKN